MKVWGLRSWGFTELVGFGVGFAGHVVFLVVVFSGVIVFVGTWVLGIQHARSD